jgi:hypothetical protein
MSMGYREVWTVIHGMVFGLIFLLGFGGAFYALHSLQQDTLTQQGLERNARNIKIYLWVLAGCAWAAVLTGTYIIYPWYRATPPQGGTYDLSAYPRYFLLSSAATEGWHEFGMEWKEHVAFLAPIAATVTAYAASYFGPRLAWHKKERRVIMTFFLIAFATAAAAGLFGALITKAAPVR